MKLTVTMKDLKRHKLLQDALDKRLSLKEASMLLSLSYRQALRLKEKVKAAYFKDPDGITVEIVQNVPWSEV